MFKSGCMLRRRGWPAGEHAAFRKKCPNDPGHFIGQRNGGHFGGSTRQQAGQPRRACLDTAVAPTTSKERNTGFPILEILPNRSLPPVECIFGVKPIHAAKCRPELNAPGSGTKATIVAAVMGPT